WRAWCGFTLIHLDTPMSTFIKVCLRSSARSLRYTIVISITLFAATVLQAQKLDLNANGMSDVWEQIYGASGLSPNADADGDGFSNAQEALAGTSPFSAASVPKIPTYARTGTNFTVTIPCAP